MAEHVVVIGAGVYGAAVAASRAPRGAPRSCPGARRPAGAPACCGACWAGDRLWSAVSGGAGLVRGEGVAGREVTAGMVRAVRLASGRQLPADAVVNCAGPRAARIAELAGLVLPMRNTRGVLIQTSPLAVSVSRVIHAPGVHLRPDGAGLLPRSDELDVVAQRPGTGDITIEHPT